MPVVGKVGTVQDLVVLWDIVIANTTSPCVSMWEMRVPTEQDVSWLSPSGGHLCISPAHSFPYTLMQHITHTQSLDGGLWVT